MDQQQTPLYDRLVLHAGKKPVSLHVPGHKYGLLFSGEERSFFRDIARIDATELSGLDDLHEPEGVIKEAETLLAGAYGAEKSFFLVNGSTVGNLAMILGAVNEGDTVFVQRNCHKSVLNGLQLAKARPVFLGPEIDKTWGVAGGVSLQTVEEAFARYPYCRAMIFTYPNYYGMVYELHEIIEFAHDREIPVLIDEAHGAHFSAGGMFPRSALELGADAVVQSAHKTLPAMTMGSYLHVNERYRFYERLKHYLTLLQSSSPSYPIMASLDLARFYLAQIDRDFINMIIESFLEFETKLMKIEEIRLINNDSNLFLRDPLKLIVQSALGISGFQLQQALETHAIYPELADELNVLFVLPLAPIKNSETIVQTLARIFAKAINGTRRQIDENIVFDVSKPYSTLACSYQEMMNMSQVSVPFHRAVGEVSAEAVIPYPP